MAVDHVRFVNEMTLTPAPGWPGATWTVQCPRCANSRELAVVWRDNAETNTRLVCPCTHVWREAHLATPSAIGQLKSALPGEGMTDLAELPDAVRRALTMEEQR